MGKVYIVGAARSPIGSFLGSLKSMSAAAIGKQVLTDCLKRANVDVNAIDEVIVGNVLPAGCGQGVARQISIGAGIPDTIPAYGVNMVCGSGMKAVMLAASAIYQGAGIVVAGGVESMSNAPFTLSSRVRQGYKMGEIKMADHIIADALTDAYSNVHMGVTAENIAKKHSISREEQDSFAYNSQQKAIKAVDSGAFADEIVAINVVEGRNSFVFDKDEYPNRTTDPEKLAKLRPAFVADGTVTAGNASGINDGASFTILASEEAVKKYSLKPLAELVGFGQGGVDPQVMGLGPVPAIANALKNVSMKLSDMEYLELNEAFAAQSLGVVAELSAEHGMKKEDILNRCNVNGGAIALGHPVGASGNRIIVTLLHILKAKNATYGLASLCIGGGMGTAVVLKNVK